MYALQFAFMRVLLCAVLLAATTFVADTPQAHNRVVRFVFTSDAHYGVTRRSFRGHTDVPAHDVNAALVADINAQSADGPMDFVVEGGDVPTAPRSTSTCRRRRSLGSSS